MNKLTDCYTLSNGVKIPCIGFGTWQAGEDEEAVSIVKKALECGYRHIDTAQAYNNEKSVGIAVKESGIPREEIFITSKLWNNHHSYDDAHAEFEKTLQRLGTDYLDLYLIHWPNPTGDKEHREELNQGTWKAFEELYNAKKIRAIGVSNFKPNHIDELMKTATIAPMVNQIRLCPGDVNNEIVSYCTKNNILLEAYSPFGTGKIFDVPEMVDLADKYNRSIAQICIKWSLLKGFLPLPKSVNEERIKENADVFDFTLEAEDVDYITGLDGCIGYANDSDEVDF